MAGEAAQLMVAEEVTWGVAVAPSRGLPWVGGGAEANPEYLMSDGMVAGRRLRPSGLRSLGNVTVTGTYDLELYDRSVGLLFKHMLGTVVTTGPVSSVYTHTFTPGTLTGKGLTIQEGIPDLTTTDPFTLAGGKVTSWEISCAVNELAKLSISVAGKSMSGGRTVADGATTNASPTVTSATAAFNADDVGKPISGTGIPAASYVGIVNSATSVGLSSSNTTNTPVNATATATGITFTIGIVLAAASYAANIAPMSYRNGYVKLGGTAICARSFTLTGDNGLNLDRRCIGTAFLDEPLESGGYREYGGTVEMEFQDKTQWNRFVAGTAFALEFNLYAGTSTFTATYNGYFTGSKPTVDPGSYPYVTSWPFSSEGSTDAAALTVVLANADATP